MKVTTILFCLFLLSFSSFSQHKKAHRQMHQHMNKPVLRHVVMFKFKDTSSPEDIKRVEEAFLALPKKIKEIKSLEWGLNNSPENLNQGLTHCFFLTFNSEADRAIYLPHPDHKAFGAIIGPHLDKVTVIDYWTK